MEKIIIFDFDKTLTNYDTTLPFFIHCSIKEPYRLILLPFFLIVKILSKFKLLSIKKEKEIGLLLFCPKNMAKFNNLCLTYSRKVVLNSIFTNYFQDELLNKDNQIIIISASFQQYLEAIFPSAIVIGSSLKTNNRNKIIGIDRHPFNIEKLTELAKRGISHIDILFTDSKNDLPLVDIARKTIWVANGITRSELIKQ